jgi:hypothetical protein
VENGTLALRTKKGSETMTTNATTVVVKLNGDQAALGAVSDLQNGNLVLVFRPSADSANAQVILTLDRGEALSKVGRELLQKR